MTQWAPVMSPGRLLEVDLAQRTRLGQADGHVSAADAADVRPFTWTDARLNTDASQLDPRCDRRSLARGGAGGDRRRWLGWSSTRRSWRARWQRSLLRLPIHLHARCAPPPTTAAGRSAQNDSTGAAGVPRDGRRRRHHGHARARRGRERDRARRRDAARGRRRRGGRRRDGHAGGVRARAVSQPRSSSIVRPAAHPRHPGRRTRRPGRLQDRRSGGARRGLRGRRRRGGERALRRPRRRNAAGDAARDAERAAGDRHGLGRLHAAGRWRRGVPRGRQRRGPARLGDGRRRGARDAERVRGRSRHPRQRRPHRAAAPARRPDRRLARSHRRRRDARHRRRERRGPDLHAGEARRSPTSRRASDYAEHAADRRRRDLLERGRELLRAARRRDRVRRLPAARWEQPGSLRRRRQRRAAAERRPGRRELPLRRRSREPAGRTADHDPPAAAQPGVDPQSVGGVGGSRRSGARRRAPGRPRERAHVRARDLRRRLRDGRRAGRRRRPGAGVLDLGRAQSAHAREGVRRRRRGRGRFRRQCAARRRGPQTGP